MARCKLVSKPVIEEIAKMGTILAFHVGADAPDRTHPDRVAKIARRFPEMPILMVHMGGAGQPDLGHKAIEVAQGHANTMLIGTEPILKAIQTLGASRVCFGSDAPFASMGAEVARYNAFLDDEVTEEDRHQVMAANMARLFGLEI